MKLASKIVSILFHPMLMPTIGIYLIFQAGTHVSYMSLDAKRIIYFTVFLSTAILPLSLLPLLYQFKLIKSFNMETSRERLFPVFFAGLFYYLGYALLKKMGVPGLIGNFMLVTLLALLLAVGITIFWKISMHMIGIGGVTGAVMALALRYGLDMSGWMVLLFLASGITATARLHLGAHTPAQVYAGFVLGWSVVFGSVLM
ncbi:PAP2 family protein [Natronoflexus pectinivorans]|uniref:PAP2 superfamily protein n=1 Tax=Natronoflexus pectinivorans TaxID=682526 RepID=A0A4R2GP96_9BACT|nr:PAP2 family protein [Natronoflexus pectinivorans]TCO10848.1 hypothetical protein EV194_101481 [Natronoflexus pectinivorans]